MSCCSFECPKYSTCLLAKESGACEAWASFGSGIAVSHKPVDVHYACGPLGGFRMYSPAAHNARDAHG